MSNYEDVRRIQLDQLVMSTEQARTRGVEDGLEDLVNNIRIHGQLEPIIVAPLDSRGERFEIVAGQRRFLAMQRLGHTKIYAAILRERVNGSAARVLSVSENLIRRDLDPKDLIDACTQLYRRYGSVKAVAEEVGIPYNSVRNYVKYERLRPALKELVGSGRITIKTALRIEDHYGGEEVSPDELDSLVDKLARMTNIQQTHFFKRPRTGDVPGSSEVAQSRRRERTRGGEVSQILVTLSTEDANRLRRWAKDQSMTQDQAAAEIVTAFFRAADKARERGHAPSGNRNIPHPRRARNESESAF